MGCVPSTVRCVFFEEFWIFPILCVWKKQGVSRAFERGCEAGEAGTLVLLHIYDVSQAGPLEMHRKAGDIEVCGTAGCKTRKVFCGFPRGRFFEFVTFGISSMVLLPLLCFFWFFSGSLLLWSSVFLASPLLGGVTPGLCNPESQPGADRLCLKIGHPIPSTGLWTVSVWTRPFGGQYTCIQYTYIFPSVHMISAFWGSSAFCG